ncbi:MAG: hypothetical protein NTY46_15850 [Candidatus Sumerlaeota bacterium]|nr:hypothetical protein [Candidatus Sumerlaeota bacterium]
MTPLRKIIRITSSHTMDSIHGHGVVKQYFAEAMAQNALPHALLIHGPRGVGKLSMSYALAKMVNTPAGMRAQAAAEIDRKISEGVFADLLVVEPKGVAGQITLSGWKPGRDDPDCPQYYRYVDSRPLEGTRKILIFRHAERMNPALANYLLKLIEEPPSYLLLILVTGRYSEVLPTIRSRCAPIRLSPLAASEMDDYAGNLSAAAEIRLENCDLGMLVRMSEGRPGLLLELAQSSQASAEGEIAGLMRLFQQHGFIALFRSASRMLQAGGSPQSDASTGERFEAVINAIEAWLRDVLLVKTLPSGVAERLLVCARNKDELHAYARNAPVDGLAAMVDHLREAYQFAPRQSDKNYVLESFLLKTGRSMSGKPGE